MTGYRYWRGYSKVTTPITHSETKAGSQECSITCRRGKCETLLQAISRVIIVYM